MSYSIIAAMGKNREIGIDNKIPWNIAEDIKRFRGLTRGHTVIMGRKTHESIGRALPYRTNIVITNNQDYSTPDCVVVHTLEEALLSARGDNEVFIIGGAKIYEAAMPYVDRIYLTEIDAEFNADTYLPEFDYSEWKVTSSEAGHPKESEPNFSYLIYKRIKPAIDLPPKE